MARSIADWFILILAVDAVPLTVLLLDHCPGHPVLRTTLLCFWGCVLVWSLLPTSEERE